METGILKNSRWLQKVGDGYIMSDYWEHNKTRLANLVILRVTPAGCRQMVIEQFDADSRQHEVEITEKNRIISDRDFVIRTLDTIIKHDNKKCYDGIDKMVSEKK